MQQSVPSPSVVAGDVRGHAVRRVGPRGAPRRRHLPGLALDAARRWRAARRAELTRARAHRRAQRRLLRARSRPGHVATRRDRRHQRHRRRRTARRGRRGRPRARAAARRHRRPPARAARRRARPRRSTSATSTVRWCVASKSPASRALEAARRGAPLARRLWLTPPAPPDAAGPVHLNAAFVEPLVAAPGELPAPRATDGRPGRASQAIAAAPARTSTSTGAASSRVVGRGRRRARPSSPRATRWTGSCGRRDGARGRCLLRPAAARRRLRRADAPRPRRAPRRDPGVEGPRRAAARVGVRRSSPSTAPARSPTPTASVGEIASTACRARAPPRLRGDAAYAAPWRDASQRGRRVPRRRSTRPRRGARRAHASRATSCRPSRRPRRGPRRGFVDAGARRRVVGADARERRPTRTVAPTASTASSRRSWAWRAGARASASSATSRCCTTSRVSSTAWATRGHLRAGRRRQRRRRDLLLPAPGAPRSTRSVRAALRARRATTTSRRWRAAFGHPASTRGRRARTARRDRRRASRSRA